MRWRGLYRNKSRNKNQETRVWYQESIYIVFNSMNFTASSQAILYGTHIWIVQNMLDYDFLCGRNPSVVAVFSSWGSKKKFKVFFGDKEMFIPSISHRDEVDQFPDVDTLINLASFRSCTQVNKDAINSWKFKHIFTIAEWVAERETRELKQMVKDKDVELFGPSIVGAMISWVIRVGHTWGSLDNILKSRLTTPWSVWLVTKSGGMMNELCRTISKTSDGVHSAFQVWWDRFPMTWFLPIIEYFEEHDEIKMIVLLGEVWNTIELEIADLIKQRKITKPVVAWCIGTSAETLQTEVQFGHAWAKANSDQETASYKNKALQEAWAFVPEDFDSLWEKIQEVFMRLWLPMDEQTNNKTDEISMKSEILKKRKKTNFTSTISDERGDELTYNNILISTHVEQNSIAKVIWHLWLKKDLPDFAVKFIETVLILLADHWPAVSGATNTIVSARAGKDVVSSLISWLATIWPRFGGAVTGAGKRLIDAVERNITPEELVYEMKRSGSYIQWIGHKVKSIYEPDKRCEIMQEIAKSFPSTKHLDFALAVESLTTQKKPNLILNVDGHIAALLLDMLADLWYTSEMMKQEVENDLFNAFFVLSRSIWFIWHYLDQQRLNEGLYRTPREDVLYTDE